MAHILARESLRKNPAFASQGRGTPEKRKAWPPEAFFEILIP
jgi:hypothetical protein